MGRYYSGDINGKFWFGVQDSDDPSFFGGEQIEPNYMEYYFGESHKPSIAEGVRKCREALGEFEEKLARYFAGTQYYSDDQIADALGIPHEKLRELIEWYARLELGLKIQHCVEKNGECSFDAEF